MPGFAASFPIEVVAPGARRSARSTKKGVHMTLATGSRFASLALVLVTCTATGRAEAAGDRAESRDGAWYGYQTLASDAAAFALIAGGAFLGNRMDSSALGLALGGPGAALYFAGAPLLRVVHGDGSGATHSLLRRILFPVAGAAVVGGIAALATSPGRSDVCDNRRECAALFAGGGGFAAGMIAAVLVDAVTAHEPSRADGTASEASAPPVPALAVSRGGALVGLRLVF
jgi:hypothetical protein